MAEEKKEVVEEKVKEFSLDDLMNPIVSRVTRSVNGLVLSIYGRGGLGKTPVATKMPNPFYLAFGKTGISGLNNVPMKPIMSWRDFKAFTKTFCDPKNYETLSTKYTTLIADELEVLYKYCEEYVAHSEGVNKIKEGNSGYGLWADLKSEWESEMLKLIGSGFCIIFILHSYVDDSGRAYPVGDTKRMLPIIINHSDIIGYVMDNGVNPETGRPIHSSLGLAGTKEYFARTRNEYFDPIIDDFTADNLIKAYYDAIDRQEKAEGIAPITKQEQDKIFTKKKRKFQDVMDEVQTVGEQVIQKYGSADPVLEVVEKILGVGAKVSNCTSKQQESVEVIIDELKALLEQE